MKQTSCSYKVLISPFSKQFVVPLVSLMHLLLFARWQFEEELVSLPGKYSSSNNSLLVVMVTVPFEEGQEEQPLRVIASSLRELPDGFDIIGCGALRELATDSSVTELKRLYVKPAYRRQGLARKLSIFLIDEARARGYKSVFLDTLERLAGALELYRQLDFEEIEAYYHNPMEDVVYMKLDL